MKKQNIVLIAAVVCGLLAAFLTRTYLASKDAEVRRLTDSFRSRHGVMEVLCFARAVPGGTVLSKDDLGLKNVPAAGLRGQALTRENAEEVIGKRTVLGHALGDVLFWSDVEGGHPLGGGGLAGDIARRKRAISINVYGAAAVSGMVRPSDHVDVIGTFSFPVAGEKERTELVTHTMLQNVLVLATGRETAKTHTSAEQRNAGNYSTVTLEVSPREAEMLVFAEQIKGRLHLALRNRSDTHVESSPPQVDFKNIRSEIEALDKLRQAERKAR